MELKEIRNKKYFFVNVTHASDNLIDYAPHNKQYVMLHGKVYRVLWMKTVKIISNLFKYIYI